MWWWFIFFNEVGGSEDALAPIRARGQAEGGRSLFSLGTRFSIRFLTRIVCLSFSVEGEKRRNFRPAHVRFYPTTTT